MTQLAVAFADLAGFTALTEAHGDEDAADVAEAFYAMARACLTGDARLVKPIGDAVLLVGSDAFATVSTLQRLGAAVDRRPEFPGLRAGLHFGPVVERDGDVFGSTVNVAARVAAHARSGQTLCTAALRDALGAACPSCTSLGLVKLKNVLEPLELFELTAEGPRSNWHLDPVCRMQVPPGSAWEARHAGKTVRFCSQKCRDAFVAAPGRFGE